MTTVLKRVTAQIENELQATIVHTQAGLKRGNSKALQNVATCCVLLLSRVVKVRCSLPDTTDFEAGFRANIAAVKTGQTGEAKASQASEGSTENGVTKNW